jgi:hypothetical protein
MEFAFLFSDFAFNRCYFFFPNGKTWFHRCFVKRVNPEIAFSGNFVSTKVQDALRYKKLIRFFNGEAKGASHFFRASNTDCLLMVFNNVFANG